MQLRYISFILQRLGFNIEAKKSDIDKDGVETTTKSAKSKENNFNITVNNSADSKPNEGGGSYKHNFSFTDSKVGKSAASCLDSESSSAESIAKMSKKKNDANGGSKKKNCANPAFYIVFRSPESIIRYLGRVVAGQIYSDPPISATVHSFKCKEGYREVPLFEIRRGKRFLNSTSVSVTDDDGEDFYIPTSDYRNKCRARSMESLALAADIINGAVSKKVIPQINSVNLLSSQ